VRPFGWARISKVRCSLLDIQAYASSLAGVDWLGGGAAALLTTTTLASLLPFVLFLYFIGWPGNGTPRSAAFGFQLLLLCPLATALTEIVAKSSFALRAADVDWLHGTSEVLLATASLYVASGFRDALAGEEARYGPEERYGPPSRFPAFAVVWFAVLATAYGPSVGFGEHSAFLLGLGNLGTDQLDTLAVATEPSNALSIPTWTVHFASAFGWLYATGMVNRYGEYTGNPKWRLLAFAMLPLHASGVAGCTYHFFFNSPDVSFLVALQAGLALIGHTALLIAAALLSLSNGWNVRMAIESATLSSANRAYRKRQLFQQQQGGRVPYDMRPTWLTVGGLGALSLLASYITKYAALTTRVPFDPSEGVLTGWLVCLAIPALVGYRFSSLSPAFYDGGFMSNAQLRRSRGGQPLGARRVFQNSPPYYGSSMGDRRRPDLRRPFGTDAPRMPEVPPTDDPRQAPAGSRWRPPAGYGAESPMSGREAEYAAIMGQSGAARATGANEGASAPPVAPPPVDQERRSLSPGIQNNFYDQAQSDFKRPYGSSPGGAPPAPGAPPADARSVGAGEQPLDVKRGDRAAESANESLENELAGYGRAVDPLTGARRLRSAPEIFFTGLKNLLKDPLGWLSRDEAESPKPAAPAMGSGLQARVAPIVGAALTIVGVAAALSARQEAEGRAREESLSRELSRRLAELEARLESQRMNE
jgi:hypothetical protein